MFYARSVHQNIWNLSVSKANTISSVIDYEVFDADNVSASRTVINLVSNWPTDVFPAYDSTMGISNCCPPSTAKLRWFFR